MKYLLKLVLFLVLAANLVMPLMVWWPLAGASFSLPFTANLYLALFFPLLGLYALNLLWVQFMVGAWRSALGQLFDPAKVLRWHIWEGVVAYVFALLHPMLLFASIKLIGLSYFGVLTSLPELLKLYWATGILAFLLLTLAVLSGLLSQSRFIVRHWKKVHYLTYLVLPLILYHSWQIGSHVQSTMFRYVWYVFVGTYAITAVVRLAHHIKKYKLLRKARSLSNQPQ